MAKAKQFDEVFRELVVSESEKLGSVNRLCKAAGVPQSSVSAWMTGVQESLHLSVVKKLCDYCGATMTVIPARSDRKKRSC